MAFGWFILGLIVGYLIAIVIVFIFITKDANEREPLDK